MTFNEDQSRIRKGHSLEKKILHCFDASRLPSLAWTLRTKAFGRSENEQGGTKTISYTACLEAITEDADALAPRRGVFNRFMGSTFRHFSAER